MIVINALEEIKSDKPSIFLAGPTPRSEDVPSWRPDALAFLEKYNFDGYVFVPEQTEKNYKENYYDQIQWEEDSLYTATCILFWIPRNMETMPGLTTNDEWGFWKASGKVVLGCPTDAENVRYQIHYANEYGVPFSNYLDDTVQNAIDMVNRRIK